MITACALGLRARANLFLRDAPGAAATRPSLRPPFSTRVMNDAKLGRNAPRGRGDVSTIFSWPILRDGAVAPPQDDVVISGSHSRTVMVRRRVSAVSNHEQPRSSARHCEEPTGPADDRLRADRVRRGACQGGRMCSPVIASAAKQSGVVYVVLDCFVASLLAMTERAV